MTATTARGITYPTTSDTITPLANRFATLATTTDTAIGNLATPSASFKGTDATRLALGAGTVPALAEGLEWYSTDTDRRWFYTGSAWIAADIGTYVIVPTSVAGGTISADGTIVPTAATGQVSVNGAFTSRFRTYRVEYRLDTGAAASLRLQWRRAGANLSGASYTHTRAYVSATGNTQSSQVFSGTYVDIDAGGASTQRWGYFEVHEPAHTANVKFWDGRDTQVGTMALHAGVNGAPEIQAPLDGFTLFLSGSSFNAVGYIRIYGYA